MNHENKREMLMLKSSKKLTAVAVSVVLLGGLWAVKQPHAAPPAAVAKAALTVTVAQPDVRHWAERFVATGNVQAWQEAIVGAQVSGQRLAEIRVNVGDAVKRGQVLARFADEWLQAELAQQSAALDEARARLAEAENNAAGALKLKDGAAMSAQEVQQFQTAQLAARAQVKMAEARLAMAQLNVRYCAVIAPDDGVISARTATLGAVTPAGTELFRLIRGGKLEWRAELPERELQRIKLGQKVSLSAAQGAAVQGVVRRISPVVEVQTRNGAVYVEVLNAEGMKAGMFAQGEFNLGASSAMTVPQGALVVRDGYGYVYRVGKDNRVTQTKVVTGRRAEGRVEIREGLTADAQIVATGAGFLSDGDSVRVEAGKR
jgi:HlyD family secretion protein